MSRINTNVSALIARRNLSENNNGLNTTLERLSTGLRINRGKDDPAGLIASENLRAEKSALTAAISNAERADQIVNIAEGGLQELSNLLTDLRGLVTATANGAGLSNEEKNANQLQIDSILQTIDRLSESTNFQGVKLLNGNLDFTTTGLGPAVTDFRVNAAKLSNTGSQSVQAAITASAQRAGVELRLATSAINPASGSLLRIEVAGATGSREFSFGRGTTIAAAATAINAFKEVLGVSAAVGLSNRGLVIKSTEFGADQFSSVRVVDTGGLTGATLRRQVAANEGVFTSTSQITVANNVTQRDVGQNIAGSINGLIATGKGRTLSVASDFLDVSISLRTSAAQQIALPISAFTITGGGAQFQLASNVDLNGRVSLGIQNVSSRSLGSSTLGTLSDLASGKVFNVNSRNADTVGAAKVVEEAIRQVSALRGRLGAFQKNNIGATIRNLGISLENTSSAESVIRDADFAKETANLTRGQILSQAAGNSLGLANQQPQSALQLLRG
jgi:flagellin